MPRVTSLSLAFHPPSFLLPPTLRQAFYLPAPFSFHLLGVGSTLTKFLFDYLGHYYSNITPKPCQGGVLLCWSPTCRNYRRIRTTKKVTPFPSVYGRNLSGSSLGCVWPPQHGGFTRYGKLLQLSDAGSYLLQEPEAPPFYALACLARQCHLGL